MSDFYGEGDRIGVSSKYKAATVEPSGEAKTTVEGQYGVAMPKYITKDYQDKFHVPSTIIHTNDKPIVGGGDSMTESEEEF